MLRHFLQWVNLPGYCLGLGMLCCGILPGQVIAGDMAADMAAGYQAFAQSRGADALPFTVDSGVDEGRRWASVQTFFAAIDFDLLAQRLSDITQWCEFIPLHLNIKACAYYLDAVPPQLRFYIGRKGYAVPNKAQSLNLSFTAEQTDGILNIIFTAPRGPFGSSNYRFHLRALGVANGVYLEFDLASNPGMVTKLSKLYFLTKGSDKVGFTRVGDEATGWHYVQGERGGVERNIVRYLYSIQAYFDTIDREGEPDIYQLRAQRWFALTERHNKQLYEMPREKYLSIKARERRNHDRLLTAIAQGIEADFGAEQNHR